MPTFYFYFLYHTICRKFNITLISAHNLPNVRTVFDNRVEARVTIGGEKKTEKKTPADKQNGLDPAWNYMISYTIGESGVIDHDLSVAVRLYTKRTLGDKFIGEVSMSVKELFESASAGNATLALPVKKGEEELTSAVLNISFSFGERVSIEKHASWKKVLSVGANIFLKVFVEATLGVVIEIPVYVDDDIIDL
ncbi:hypothetical protein ACJIZ3_024571 [Penstemon smallii]|uniref:C2 domain-containing protein n=1 Tax=Penstemon smallii TaxID=265156 RepID=A0ABD3TUP4_9LAMI